MSIYEFEDQPCLWLDYKSSLFVQKLLNSAIIQFLSVLLGTHGLLHYFVCTGGSLHFGQFLLILLQEFRVGFEKLEELLLLGSLFVKLGCVFRERIHI